MDFGFSQDQEHLRESVREFLRNEAPTSFAREMMDHEQGVTEAAWRMIAGLGWTGLTIAEDYGGSGLGALELAIVMEELGEVVYPGPLASTLCLGIPALQRFASPAQRTQILPEVAAGDKRITTAIAERRGRWSADGIDATAERAVSARDTLTLSGRKMFVPDARSADTIVIAARLDGGIGLFAVPASTRGLSVIPMKTVDQTRKLDVVVLENAAVADVTLLGGRAIDADALDDYVDYAKTMLAAELCGLADAALRMSVEYAKIREQFGRPIGTFQAIQHKLADMKVLLENARSLVYYAAWAIDAAADDRRLAAAMAKAYASEGCTRVIADAIQAHGGIGFTWEHDLHLYFKRAKASEVTYGNATDNRETIAQLLELR